MNITIVKKCNCDGVTSKL